MSLADAVPSLAGKRPQQHAGMLFVRGGTFRMGSDKYYPEEAPVAVRYDDWKVTFKTIKGNLFTGTEESTNVPPVTNLRQDPWERYQDQSMMYARWWGDKLCTLIPSSAIVGQFLMTFKEYPPSQTSGTFGIEKALKMIEAGSSGGGK